MLEISDLGSRVITSAIYEVKTKKLISSGVTAWLICAFVFAYAKSMFSHYASRLSHFMQDNLWSNKNFISSPVQSTGIAIVVTLASALALPLPLALPFPSRHF